MQLTANLVEGLDPQEVEAAILAVPGVTRFVRVFPDKPENPRLYRLAVVDVESTEVVDLLKALPCIEEVWVAPPRYPAA